MVLIHFKASAKATDQNQNGVALLPESCEPLALVEACKGCRGHDLNGSRG